MSARIAHRTFVATARRSVLRAGFSPASRMTCRNSSSSSHGPELSSDKPWIIGSLLIFGSAFLYLVSPSARKTHHTAHKDKHEFPALAHEEHSVNKPEPELMKDDEGKVADVASSVALAESSDIPNDAQSAEQHVELKAEAEEDSSKPIEQDSGGAPPTTDGEKAEQTEESVKEVKTEVPGEGGRKLPKEPTSMGEARESAVKHITPKEGAKSKN